MKTQIFKDRADFANRTDKSLNGVDQTFADNNPGWDKEAGNNGCWNCSGCSDCIGCTDCFRCSRCSICTDCSLCSSCSDCIGCTDCFRCSRCSICTDCSRCSRCTDCIDCIDCTGCSGCADCIDCIDCTGCSDCDDKKDNTNTTQTWKVPLVDGIHQKVYAAASRKGALDMDNWHTCETTHCRAGWVVHLAGAAGQALEQATSTSFAAQMIYRESSPIKVSPVRFYENADTALKDMKRCAEEEKGL